MSDIVERLRFVAGDTVDKSRYSIFNDAATEIERLRAEAESYQSQFFAEHDRYMAEKVRAEKAEAEVEKWQNIFSKGIEDLAQKEPNRECGTCVDYGYTTPVSDKHCKDCSELSHWRLRAKKEPSEND